MITYEQNLTPEQIAEIKQEMVAKGEPVRFLHEGQNLNISSGRLLPKGTLVMHQIVYWNFSTETAKKIARYLGVKAVFDGGKEYDPALPLLNK
jgi:hypothetical protein